MVQIIARDYYTGFRNREEEDGQEFSGTAIDLENRGGLKLTKTSRVKVSNKTKSLL